MWAASTIASTWTRSRLAAAFPAGSVTLVGELIEPDHYAPLTALTNVEIHPRVARRELTGLVAAADVCLTRMSATR